MTPRQFLGKELCRARVTAGYSSQQALADHLGFERTVIAKAEAGERVPRDPVLTAWAKACDIDTEHYQRPRHPRPYRPDAPVHPEGVAQVRRPGEAVVSL